MNIVDHSNFKDLSFPSQLTYLLVPMYALGMIGGSYFQLTNIINLVSILYVHRFNINYSYLPKYYVWVIMISYGRLARYP
jgi:hypothetical protein